MINNLWDDVDVPISTTAHGLGSFFLAELLVKLIKRSHGSSFSAVVRVSVHVKDLFALNGKDTGKNALGKASSENDNIVFFIHIEEC